MWCVWGVKQRVWAGELGQLEKTGCCGVGGMELCEHAWKNVPCICVTSVRALRSGAWRAKLLRPQARQLLLVHQQHQACP